MTGVLSVPPPPGVADEREVSVALEDMKFSSAHFVAFQGFRESLHGHNYTVALRAGGSRTQDDGYVADFGHLKKAARQICRSLNQKTLIPTRSDVLKISRAENNSAQVNITCEDGAIFSFPEEDCAMIPVIHTTAEELSEHIWWELLITFELGSLFASREIHWLEVTVSERPGQAAKFRSLIARANLGERRRSAKAVQVPRPCFGFGMQASRSGGCGSAGRQQATTVATSATGMSSVDDAEAMVPFMQQKEDDGETAYRKLLVATLGPEEASRPELVRTPYRAAKAFREMTIGHKRDPLDAVGDGIFDLGEARDLVCIRDIPFHSMCEHHLLPFAGVAHVAYFPRGKVLGLSKFPRLLEVFARRLQLQERLSAEFAESIVNLLEPSALAVGLEATHGCMCHRGIGVNASTRTVAFRGPDREDSAVKEQLLNGIAFSSSPLAARSRM